MRKMRRMVIPVLLIFGLMLTTVPVYAADELLGTVVDGSLLTEETEAEGIAYPKLRGTYFAQGTGSVGVVGLRQVRLSGTTSAYQNVARIQVTMYLQRLKSGSWVHVLTMGPKIKYNTNFVSNSSVYSVTGGYYYRAYGHHTVMQGGTTESGISHSDGIWIS